MISVIFNAVAYISILLVNWGRKKPLKLYSYLILIWGVSAICGYFVYLLDPNLWRGVVIWPFIYLLVVFLVFIKPFKSFNINNDNLSVGDNKSLEFIAWIYVVTGVLSIIYTLPEAIVNYRAADWDALRDDVYMDNDAVVMYHSSFERIVKNIHAYLDIFATVYAFYLLSKPKSNRLLIVLIFLTWFGSSFAGSIIEAGRGMIIKQFMNAGLLYVIFRNNISQYNKRRLRIAFIIIIVMVSFYIVAVTISRFGSGDSGKNSVLYYIGHSMLNFNYGIAQNIQDFAHGKRFFKWFIDFFGGNSFYGSLRHMAGTGFVTFIGNFYMDFGAIGTFVLSLLMLPVINNFTRKKYFRLSDLTVIVFFAEYYMNGIFVYAPGSSLQWFITFIIYFIIRRIESTNTNTNNVLYAKD